jgi:regulatory protein
MRPGRKAPAARRAELAAIEDPEVVVEAALRFLEVRPRSTAEVVRRLTFAGYRPELVSGAVERLTALGMLDDAAFAQAWVESRDRAHPRGERALRRELQLKGIDRAVIDEVLETREAGQGSETSDPDQVAAERLLARHAAALGRVADPRARRQRAYALLARHGFDPETAGRLAGGIE